MSSDDNANIPECHRHSNDDEIREKYQCKVEQLDNQKIAPATKKLQADVAPPNVDMQRDKKNEGGIVTLVLLKRLGEAYLDRSQSADALTKFLRLRAAD